MHLSVGRSVGAYSCHEDNLTFNIHHNSAMRVHFDWHMSALSSFILLHFTSNWFVRFMTTIAVWCTILIVYIHAIHFSSFFFYFRWIAITYNHHYHPFTWYSFKNLERMYYFFIKWDANLARLITALLEFIMSVWE